jgi:hypothetical protein
VADNQGGTTALTAGNDTTLPLTIAITVAAGEDTITAWGRVELHNTSGGGGDCQVELVLQGVGGLDDSGVTVPNNAYVSAVVMGQLSGLAPGSYTIEIICHPSVNMSNTAFNAGRSIQLIGIAS